MLPSCPLPPLCSPSRRRQAFRVALCLLAGAALAGAARADGQLCPSSPSSPPSAAGPFPREPAPSLGAGLDILSDHATASASGNLTLKGHVVIRQGHREVEAGEAHYDRATNSLTVKGAVTYQDPVVRLRGHGGHYSPAKGAQMRAARFRFRRRSGRGSAKRLDLSPRGILRLKGVTFTTCRASDHSWLLKARSLKLDTHNQVGTGRDARVDFKGVPILYLPWLSFPLSNARKSGFLFPSVGNSSSSGAQLEIPYYWNIAPNADLTFSPLYYTRRGIDLAGAARWLTPGEHGELDWHYLPNDQLAHQSRSLVSLKDEWSLPAALRLRLDAANVSDPHYFEDFGSGPASTSTAFLRRLVELTYHDASWNLGLEAQQFQPVAVKLQGQDYLQQAYRPYSLAPRLYADGDFGWGPDDLLRYGFDSELVNFTRSTGITGWRLDLRPRIGIDYEAPGYYVRSSVAWRYTRYQLDNVLPGADRSPSRSLPVASFASGLQFYRLLGARGERTLTLEPRLLYLYIPYRNQSALPLFDTALPDLNLVELFRTNRYVGADRVSDADQLTLGLTSRLFDTSSGRQYLSASLGEAYYIRTPRVELPGENLAHRHESDLVGEFVVSAYQNWNVHLNLDWNPAASQEERTFVQLQYKPSAESVVNVGYRFQRNVVHASALTPQGQILASYTPSASVPPGESLDQAEVSGAWPIGRHWHVIGRWVYDLDAHKSLDDIAGFEYRACCWRVRLLARRYLVNGTGQQNTAVLFQLQLTGLGGVGPATNAFLGSAIRGYSAALPMPSHP